MLRERTRHRCEDIKFVLGNRAILDWFLFICSSFNDASSTTKTIRRRMNGEYVNDELERSGRGLISRHYPVIRLGRLKKTTTTPQSGWPVCGPKFEPGFSGMWNRSVNHSTTTCVLIDSLVEIFGSHGGECVMAAFWEYSHISQKDVIFVVLGSLLTKLFQLNLEDSCFWTLSTV
jgi:hypothetical protein